MFRPPPTSFFLSSVYLLSFIYHDCPSLEGSRLKINKPRGLNGRGKDILVR